jgi:hypothetical protein
MSSNTILYVRLEASRNRKLVHKVDKGPNLGLAFTSCQVRADLFANDQFLTGIPKGYRLCGNCARWP